MINQEIAQKNFDLACRIYEESKETIRELTSYAKTVSPNFSFEIAMKQYDLLLQGILLAVAMEDGYFLEEERQFIEKITDYGDIISHFNKKGISISWNTFSLASAEERKDMSLKMLVLLKEVANDFITPFAILDAVLPKDYCTELTDKIGMICITLAECDGDSDETSAYKSETITAVTLIRKVIKEKWNEIIEVRNNKSTVQNRFETPTHANSLKENFLKKKTLM